MRLVNFAPLARSVSAIGFGCASLGSRIDAQRGVAALARAYDAGVSWFDVAPSYGDGHAETILGEFLSSRRAHVTLCTKVGKLPGAESLAARVLRPVAQRALKVAPHLRKLAAHRSQTQQTPLTGPFIESSITESLKRLRTDYVDVLALHDPALADIQREDVLRALENVVARGLVRCVSIAGSLDVALQAISLSEKINIIQVANNFFTPNIEVAKRQLPQEKVIGFVGHTVYGHAGPLDRFTDLINKQPAERALLEAAGYCGTARQIAAAYLLDFALATNPEGVVLLSMYDDAHLHYNVDRAAPTTPDAVLALKKQLANLR